MDETRVALIKNDNNNNNNNNNKELSFLSQIECIISRPAFFNHKYMYFDHLIISLLIHRSNKHTSTVVSKD